MSHEALPIDIPSFTRALESLPVDALHTKAAEIRNSISHLRSSNEQMLPFADQGDQDCKDAMYENLVVIGRMNERIELLRAEAEKRGLQSHGLDAQYMIDRNGLLVNGNAASREQQQQPVARDPSRRSALSTDQESTPRTTLVDESRIPDNHHSDDEEGIHL